MQLLKATTALVSITSVFAGQCSSAESALWIGNMEFTTILTQCAVKAMGGDQATANCLKNAYEDKLGDACAACFGQTVKCGTVNCAVLCADDAGDAACLACTKEKGCDDGLDACTGFSQGPPKPLPADANNRNDGKSSVSLFSVTASFIGVAVAAVL